jgi:hypothetical protein
MQIFTLARYDEHGRIIKKEPIDDVPGVYFFAAAGVNLIKIGYVRKSRCAIERLHALQPGCPYRLHLLFVLSGVTRLDESRLHKLFAEYNHDREWFRCEGKLKEIMQLAIAMPDMAATEFMDYLRHQKHLT